MNNPTLVDYTLNEWKIILEKSDVIKLCVERLMERDRKSRQT